MNINIHARASDVSLTDSEIATATEILSRHPTCVATVQRQMRIGWNRAADLIARIKGREALPEVAQRLF